MLYAVLFDDDPDLGTEVRRRHMPAHLAFLDRNAAAIRAAGPLLSSAGQAEGGLWLVAADDPEDVDSLVRKDPFWSTGLRRSVRILAWRQVFADGRRLI